MPRRNRPRAVPAEANISERVRRARVEKGWSLAAFAKKMTDLGCPIRPSAIQRIETGDPPRTISANEALAIAAILGVSIGRLYLHPDDDLSPLMRERLLYMKQTVDDFRFARAQYVSAQESCATSIEQDCAWLQSVLDSEDEALEVILELYDYMDADEKKWFGSSFPASIRKGNSK